jgi:hypothetical protein
MHSIYITGFTSTLDNDTMHQDDGRLGAIHTGFVNVHSEGGGEGENCTGNDNGCIIIIDYYPE